MFAGKIVILLGLAQLINVSTSIPLPDSAGIVEMVNGLAYGTLALFVTVDISRSLQCHFPCGIPYGSVSGMVAKYPGFSPQQANLQSRPLSTVKAVQPVIVTPNFRATRLATTHGTRPVQIYNLPGVIAPGIVGTISQIGF